MFLKFIGCLLVPIIMIVASLYGIINPLKCGDALHIKMFNKNEIIKKFSHRLFGIISLVFSSVVLVFSCIFLSETLKGQLKISIASLYVFLMCIGSIIISILITFICVKIKINNQKSIN